MAPFEFIKTKRDTKMKWTPFSVAVATGLVVGAGAFATTDAQAQESFRVSGNEVAIYNLAGKALITVGSGSEVVVRVTRGGSDAQRLSVEVGEVGGRETLRVVYPDDQIVYEEMGRRSQTQIRVRANGTFGDGGRGGDRVEIHGSGGGLEAWADLEIQVPAGTEFSLYLGVGEMEAEGLDGDIRLDASAGAVTATDMSGSLIVDTGSGSVEVLGMQGDLNVDTGSGSVTLRDIAGSELSVDTGSGGVEGANIAAESVEIDTGSGGITLDGLRSEEVSLDTGSGSITVELLTDVEMLEIDTGSGSVTVTVPESMGAQIEIETGSGGIDLDFPVQIRRASRDHVVGTVGDGRGEIHIDTGSGSVRLIRG